MVPPVLSYRIARCLLCRLTRMTGRKWTCRIRAAVPGEVEGVLLRLVAAAQHHGGRGAADHHPRRGPVFRDGRPLLALRTLPRRLHRLPCAHQHLTPGVHWSTTPAVPPLRHRSIRHLLSASTCVVTANAGTWAVHPQHCFDVSFYTMTQQHLQRMHADCVVRGLLQVPSEQRALAKLWEVAERNREFGAGDPEPQSVRLTITFICALQAAPFVCGTQVLHVHGCPPCCAENRNTKLT